MPAERAHDTAPNGAKVCTATALGMFDGVHLGHQRILERTVKLALERDCVPAVYSFLEHPNKTLRPERAPAQLTNALRRAELFRACGIERVDLVPFDLAYSKQSAEEFVQRVIVERMRACAVIVGFNYHFGHNREGNPDVLRELGKHAGFDVQVVQPVLIDGQPVSSSRIRNRIQEGHVAAAAELLGRPVRCEGLVIRGAGLAQTIGFPTANLFIDEDLVVPGDGVYAVSIPAGEVSPRTVSGIAYHGRRPTHQPGVPRLAPETLERLLEVHLFDWQGDLIERRLRVDLHAKMRDDMHFDRVDDLVRQIRRDVELARELVTEATAPGATT